MTLVRWVVDPSSATASTRLGFEISIFGPLAQLARNARAERSPKTVVDVHPSVPGLVVGENLEDWAGAAAPLRTRSPGSSGRRTPPRDGAAMMTNPPLTTLAPFPLFPEHGQDRPVASRGEGKPRVVTSTV